MRRFVGWGLVAAACLWAQDARSAPDDGGVATARALAKDPRVRAKVRGGLVVSYATRPDVRGGLLSPQTAAPVTIRLAHPPSSEDAALLEKIGVAVTRDATGQPVRIGQHLLARVTASLLPSLAALPWVEEIRYDGAPFGLLRPLDVTAAEIDADDVWRTLSPDGTAYSGDGITVCDSDSGVDIFHPNFFRADGGYFAWDDVHGNGKLDPGVDTVSSLSATATLEILNGTIRDPYGEPILGSSDPKLNVGLDWLYLDLNGNGVRDIGPAAGFSDADPAFGEPLFVVDDIDGDGTVDVGERLVRLSSSKIAMVRFDGTDYRRGENLINTPRNEDIAHGTGSAGVIVSGQRGFSTKVGIAPEADLIMAARSDGSDLVGLTEFCVQQGARVVLHEYAPWTGYHLDGSDPMEQLIDESTFVKRVAHINPAGNLSTSQKSYKRVITPGVTTDVAIAAPADSPYAPFNFMGLSFLWRDTDRDLDIVIEDPNGLSFQVPASMAYQQFDGGIWIYTERDDSSRGTARVDVYLFDPDGTAELNPGDWTAKVTDPSPPAAGDIELIGMVIDDISGWAMGIHFPEDATEDHLIGWPGTADYGIAVAAYTGTGIVSGTPGERAYYSGRGYRIDGVDILSISAPADPIVPAYRDNEEASYRVYGGTSGASPHVAGVAALLAQQNPEATGEDIRSLIRDNALVDDNVGEVPNHDWGYGKLRAYNAMFGEDPPGGSAPIISPVDGQVYRGEATTVAIGVNDAEEPEQLVIEVDDDYDGVYDRTLEANTYEVNFAELGVFYSKLRVSDPTGRSAAALARFEVIERPPAPKTKRDDDPPPVVNGRGAPCLCAAPGTPSSPQPYAWLALGLAIASFRVRRSGRNRDRSSCRANRRRPDCGAS